MAPHEPLAVLTVDHVEDILADYVRSAAGSYSLDIDQLKSQEVTLCGDYAVACVGADLPTLYQRWKRYQTEASESKDHPSHTKLASANNAIFNRSAKAQAAALAYFKLKALEEHVRANIEVESKGEEGAEYYEEDESESDESVRSTQQEPQVGDVSFGYYRNDGLQSKFEMLYCLQPDEVAKYLNVSVKVNRLLPVASKRKTVIQEAQERAKQFSPNDGVAESSQKEIVRYLAEYDFNRFQMAHLADMEERIKMSKKCIRSSKQELRGAWFESLPIALKMRGKNLSAKMHKGRSKQPVGPDSETRSSEGSSSKLEERRNIVQSKQNAKREEIKQLKIRLQEERDLLKARKDLDARNTDLAVALGVEAFKSPRAWFLQEASEYLQWIAKHILSIAKQVAKTRKKLKKLIRSVRYFSTMNLCALLSKCCAEIESLEKLVQENLHTKMPCVKELTKIKADAALSLANLEKITKVATDVRKQLAMEYSDLSALSSSIAADAKGALDLKRSLEREWFETALNLRGSPDLGSFLLGLDDAQVVKIRSNLGPAKQVEPPQVEQAQFGRFVPIDTYESVAWKRLENHVLSEETAANAIAEGVIFSVEQDKAEVTQQASQDFIERTRRRQVEAQARANLEQAQLTAANLRLRNIKAAIAEVERRNELNTVRLPVASLGVRRAQGRNRPPLQPNRSPHPGTLHASIGEAFR